MKSHPHREITVARLLVGAIAAGYAILLLARAADPEILLSLLLLGACVGDWLRCALIVLVSPPSQPPR